MTGTFRRFTGPALFTLLCLLWLFIQLLPLGHDPDGWPGPDLMLCLALAWTVRRPEDLPVLLLAALFLSVDLLLMRPPGLGAALALIALQSVRRRQDRMRALSFWAEMLLAAAVIFGLALANWAVLQVMLVQQPGLTVRMAHALSTLAAYPLVVAVLHFALDIRKRPVPAGFGRSART